MNVLEVGIEEQQENVHLSFDTNMRMLSCLNEKSINCIENFSNEIFHEIFDYLDGFDIYQAFSNLNDRFENLINSSCMRLQCSSSTIVDVHYREFFHLNKHRIMALQFSNTSMCDDFIDFHIIDSSLLRLQSLVLKSMTTMKLILFLVELRVLPQLRSLIIQVIFAFGNLGEIYGIIFHLFQLESFKLKTSDIEELEIDLPIDDTSYFSHLKYLAIHHTCDLNQLMHLLFYLPQLVHLSCDYLMKSTTDTQFDMVIQLTHLSIVVGDIDFYELETFLCRLCSQLEVFRIKIHCSDENYLDANRWEDLILEKMVLLKKFFFSYTFSTDKHFNVMMSHPFGSINNKFTNF